MAYTKQTWKQYDDNKTEEQNIQDGAVVTAERMNHIEEGIDQQAPLTDFTTHKNDKTNPHGVTKSQVGLGNVDNVQQAPLTDFTTHKNDKTNPHSVTKAQTGLGNVDNYSTANQAEAELGTSSSRFMTPLRVFQAIAKWASGKFMELTGNQTVAGTKNFSSQPSFNGALLMPLDSKGVVRYKMSASNSTNIASGGVDIIRFGDLVIVTGLCSLNKAVGKDGDVFGNFVPDELVPTQDIYQGVFMCSWGGNGSSTATEIRSIITRYGRSWFAADQPITNTWINIWGSYQVGKGETPIKDSSSLFGKR
ncbi:hypothetical protein [Enterococcus sp. AZ103]|uniref:hypothetical protein n=1 Tax=Enterococcus sp. AZ103 TaxID=2774628 RepID=UPI003F284D4F